MTLVAGTDLHSDGSMLRKTPVVAIPLILAALLGLRLLRGILRK